MSEQPKQRRKMSLMDQAAFIRGLADRCTMHGPEYRGEVAGFAVLAVTSDDYEALSVVGETLQFLDVHGAEQMIREKFFGKKRRQHGAR